jgi:hypothetical protein
VAGFRLEKMQLISILAARTDFWGFLGFVVKTVQLAGLSSQFAFKLNQKIWL